MTTTNQIIRLRAENKSRKVGLSPVLCKLLVLFNYATIQAFTKRSKSNHIGDPGATALLLGHSTFGGTGRLYSLYPAVNTNKGTSRNIEFRILVVALLCSLPFFTYTAHAQRLLDAYSIGGPITNITATSGGVNSSIAVAYSVRQLKSTYDHAAITPPTTVAGFTNSTKPLLRVRRSTDDKQLDIGYDIYGLLDTATVRSFVTNNGASPTANGFVSVWYDQSGNSRDASQTTLASQLRIMNAGVQEVNAQGIPGVVDQNGLWLQDEGNSAPNGPNRYGIVGDRTFTVVLQPKTYTANKLITGHSTTGPLPQGTHQGYNCIEISASNTWGIQVGKDSPQHFDGNTVVSATRQDAVTMQRSGNNYMVYVNNILNATGSTSETNKFDALRMGYGDNHSQYIVYGELLLFSSLFSSVDLATLYADQGSLYQKASGTGKMLDIVAEGGSISTTTKSSGGVNSSISVAYSVRQLKTTYDHTAITPPSAVSGFTNSTTPLIRVRRSTDSAQLDLGYDSNGLLDTVAVKNFVFNNGANPTASGFVSVWYDQSGNSRDASQTTLGYQLRIVNAGVLEVNAKGIPGVADQNGLWLQDQGNSAPNGPNRYGVTADRTFTVVLQPKILISGKACTGHTTTGPFPQGTHLGYNMLTTSGVNWAMHVGKDAPNTFSGNTAASTTRQDAVTIQRTGNTYKLYVNGALSATGTNTESNYFDGLRMGYGNNEGQYVVFDELLLFPSLLSSSDHAAMHKSQAGLFLVSSGKSKLLDIASDGGPLSTGAGVTGGVNSSIAVAYSVRQLKTTYDHSTAITPPTAVSGFTNSNTPLLRVRRSSDDKQLDIGYDSNGLLDTATVRTFVSGNGANPTASGFVSVWYDQSGNSRDASQTTLASQLRIVNAGVMEVNAQGVPGVVDQNGLWLQDEGPSAPNGPNRYGITADRTFTVVLQPKTFTANKLITGHSTTGPLPQGAHQGYNCIEISASNTWGVQVGKDSPQHFDGNITVSATRQDAVTMQRSGNNYQVYVNNTLVTTGSTSETNKFDALRLGYGDPNSQYIVYSEALLFGSALSAADRQTINTSQYGTFYIGGTQTWAGTTSTDWNTASNWQSSTKPFSASAVSVPSGTPNALIIDASLTTLKAGKLTINSGATVTINGNLSLIDSVNANGTITGTGVVTLTGLSKQYIKGTFNNLTSCNIKDSICASGSLTVNGALINPTGGVLNMNTNALGGTLSSITNNGTIITASTSVPPLPTGKTWGGIVEYSALTGGQTVVAGTYNTLTLDNTSGTNTASGNLMVNGTVTVKSGGTLSMSTGTLSGTTITNNGTIKTAHIATTSPIPTGRTWAGTIEYNATTGRQTVVTGTYNNLTLSNTSDTSTAGGNLTVNGILTTTSGGTLDLSTYLLSGTLSTITNNGTIRTANTTATPLPVGRTWGGTVNYSAPAGGQTIVSATSYANLTLSSYTGTHTVTANLVLNGAFKNLYVGDTLNMGTYSLAVTGSLNNHGVVATSSTINPPIPSYRTWSGSGTIVYALTNGGQSVSGGAFDNIVMLNTSGTNNASFSSSNTVINGTLTMAPGGTWDLLFGRITGSPTSVSVSGSTIRTSYNLGSPLPTGNSWGTIEYYHPSGGQTITSGNYENLKFLNTSGTQSLEGTTTVSNVITLMGGKLALGSNTLTINGSLSGHSASASLVANGSSNLVIGGSGALGSNLFFDQTTPGTTNRLNNLTYNRGSQTITLGNALQVAGTLTPTAGTLATNDVLTLTSTATATGRIAAGAGAYITGNVTAERYIPSVTRRFRFMASPVSGSTLADWKNEIYVTGAGGTANGFDSTSTNSPSVYFYDESVTGDNNTNGWVAATNTNVALTPGKGFRVFIRGDRSNPSVLTGSTGTQAAVTMNAIGPVNNGNISMPVTYTNSGNSSYDGWSFVGNPYPSPIDWDAFHDAERTGSAYDYSGTDYAHLDAVIYIYDPAVNGYTSFNAFSGAHTGSMTNGVIPSGGAFWVKAAAASPTMTMKEIYKTGVASTGAVFKTGEEQKQFTIKLLSVIDEKSHDETAIKYVNEATSGFDAYDIRKLFGAEVNISSIGSDVSFLSANYKPFNGKSDSIILSIGIVKSGSYKLEFNDPAILVSDLPVYLVDFYTHQQVNITEGFSYPFTVDINNAQTKGNNRFMIVVGDVKPTTTAVEEINSVSNVFVYPTVTNGGITITTNTAGNEPVLVTITDVTGKEIERFNKLYWNNQKIDLDLSAYNTGAYFISVTSASTNAVFKCIKKD